MRSPLAERLLVDPVSPGRGRSKDGVDATDAVIGYLKSTPVEAVDNLLPKHFDQFGALVGAMQAGGDQVGQLGRFAPGDSQEPGHDHPDGE